MTAETPRAESSIRGAAPGDQASPQDPYDFSVVLGGPLYQIVRRAHLVGGALDLLRRRVVFFSLFAWLPLLVLSAVGGLAWGDAVERPPRAGRCSGRASNKSGIRPDVFGNGRGGPDYASSGRRVGALGWLAPHAAPQYLPSAPPPWPRVLA